MIKKQLIEMAEYNIWANNKFIDWAIRLDENQWILPLISSFENIEKTILHIVAAEKIWHERMSKNPNPEWIMDKFHGDKTELLELWQSYSQKLLELIKSKSAEEFQELFSFTNLAGAVSTMECYKAFIHVFNHSTYHRGQLTTLFRQVGFTDISTTDLINFYRGL